MVGQMVAHYEILAKIGEGGMGEVYRARDTRLQRTVAIKVLPADLAGDPERLARFEQEARMLATLSHPNVASIYGIEQHGEQRCLVMEFVDGEDLATRLTRGPIPVPEALPLARQIAVGLEEAHARGIVHRDLKPANIRIAEDGQAKLLDFGLAKTECEERAASPPDTTSPTVEQGMTRAGLVLGTPGYMSPEQARGLPVDRRTDVWSFGCVLHEMLAGEAPFSRGTVSDTLAAVLTREPDWTRLPAATPSRVRTLLRRCLAKDPSRRIHHVADVRLELDDALVSPETEIDPASNGAPRPTIENRTLRVDDAICRTLDRQGFDGLLPGWHLQYADNLRDSDTLVVWVPSIGGDHTTTQWRELIAASPYRMVTVTPVGIEPGVETRPVVSLDNQLVLIRALVRHLRDTLHPKRTIISGYSCGSIMALRCAAGSGSEDLFDGVLTIDADLQESNCFITRLFANLEPSSTQDIMKCLREVGASCSTIREWLTLHQHMLECIHKVQNDFSPLVRQGRNLSEDYEGVHCGEQSPFVPWLRQALAHVDTVRCAFHDGVENRRVLGEIRMLHLDQGVLGPRFSDDVITFVEDPDEVAMMGTERLLELVDQLVRTMPD